MEIDIDKTQEWLNRTQAIRRKPPVRGGVAKAHLTTRQTLGFVLVALLCILLLTMIPRPGPSLPKSIQLPEALASLTDLAAPVVIPPPEYLPGPPARLTQTPMRPQSQLTNYPRTWNAQRQFDHIAPHAPIWLVSEPHSWYPEPSTPQSAAQMHLPGNGTTILSR